MKNIVIIATLITGLFLWQLTHWIYQPRPLDNVYVMINKGSTSASAARDLAQADVIDKPWLFKLAARFFGLHKKLKAGEYAFQGPTSMYDVIQKMAKGDVIYRKITLAEGLTVQQMLQAIANEDLLSGDITLAVKEGELLPETYSFMRGDSKDSVIRQAQKAMQTALAEAWDNRQDDLPFKNAFELLIMASIIEKETAVDNERQLVASVFINRLMKRMKLQTDPTVIYALTNGQKDLGRPLTRKDLTIDNPYNTYKYFGLPPTPICNPGKASLAAAAHPEDSLYLYFVADGKGGHNFAASLKDHNNNVKNWKKSQK